jgi:Lrp/AsnC family leucine-responsive transcriptional regulator
MVNNSRAQAGYEIRFKHASDVQKSLNFSASNYIREVEKMDDIDREIIRILKNDGRATYSEIGKRVSLSEGAVRKRIKALVDSEIIRRFTIKLGLTEGAEAIVLLSINPSFPTSDVSKVLKKFFNVETVYEITGQYDIAVIISGLNVVEVNECIEKIRRVDGVVNTNTMIILSSW